MNLAEIYLLAKDLAVLNGRTMSDFYVNDLYANRNEFTPSVIFPVISVAGVNMSPKLQQVGRWGRHIILTFSTCTLVLKMSYRSSIIVSHGTYPEGLRHQDIGCLLTFSNTDPLYLVYSDPLCCGSLSLYPVGHIPSEFSQLGVDVLDTLFTPQYLMAEVLKLGYADKRRCVKSFLMSNNVLAWIDNEMVSEALFLSGLNPYLDAESGMSYHNSVMLVKSVRLMYQRAIECLRNDNCRTDRLPISALYSVYGREGGECVMCSQTIQRAVIEGKSTFWCPKCQTNHKKDVARV